VLIEAGQITVLFMCFFFFYFLRQYKGSICGFSTGQKGIAKYDVVKKSFLKKLYGAGMGLGGDNDCVYSFF